MLSNTKISEVKKAVNVIRNMSDEEKAREMVSSNAVALEEATFMAYHALTLTNGLISMQRGLLDKHYLRKHGENAYCVQK